jgi:hypothetical protein
MSANLVECFLFANPPRRRSPTFPGATEPARAPRVVRTLLRGMTTIDAAPRAGIARDGMVIGKERTVSAPLPLAGTIMMTGGEATVRLRVADLRWTTTRPRVAATTIPTEVDLGITLRRTRT